MGKSLSSFHNHIEILLYDFHYFSFQIHINNEGLVITNESDPNKYSSYKQKIVILTSYSANDYISFINSVDDYAKAIIVTIPGK